MKPPTMTVATDPTLLLLHHHASIAADLAAMGVPVPFTVVVAIDADLDLYHHHHYHLNHAAVDHVENRDRTGCCRDGPSGQTDSP
ncbi:hypothetical protein AVEN_128116-1 [Araneus ventricosus]|uniref:Uncharacterized protein n=1 Tax=Araneus ventricosus TaxID=182803 RepID=A0A4Y1ZZM4_ARAVE|nr:hypothetical protein AVEN_128116-1 [Araneus ventricosus]